MVNSFRFPLPPFIRRTRGRRFRPAVACARSLRDLTTWELQVQASWMAYHVHDRRQLITWLACSPARNNETAAPSGKP
jgi:hypothetical protein